MEISQYNGDEVNNINQVNIINYGITISISLDINYDVVIKAIILVLMVSLIYMFVINKMVRLWIWRYVLKKMWSWIWRYIVRFVTLSNIKKRRKTGHEIISLVLMVYESVCYNILAISIRMCKICIKDV